MANPKFHSEHCVLVTSESVDFRETRDYLEQKIHDLVKRGEHSRILIITGSHGKRNGEDGLNDLDCLSGPKKQTRRFYLEWTQSLGVKPWEDHRQYSAKNKKVCGIKKNAKIPEWVGSVPVHVPGYDKRNPLSGPDSCMEATLANFVVEIVDISFYHMKPDLLIEHIKKFAPTTLMLDWCYTKYGYTKKVLTSSGLVRKIILVNEQSLITSRGEITLSDEQTDILEKVEKICCLKSFCFL